MSWFSDFTTKLQEVSDHVAEQAKNALPLDKEMLEKLTLTTPELAAERSRIDEEERRKDHIKDCLAGLLPWETRDPERDILVEECKQSIMELSNDEMTFKGPYLMPGLAVKLTVENDEFESELDDDEDAVSVSEEEEIGERNEKPSEESLDKLATLEPLPKLLHDFDLDAHVGLIQRLLTEDPDLVKMQSELSGGGDREHNFWKNYFFHCAYARYEAGLSIDEIWNDEDPAERKAKQGAAHEASAHQGAGVNPRRAEEEIVTFDRANEESSKTVRETAFALPDPETDVVLSTEPPAKSDEAAPSASVVSSSSASAIEFENIGADTIDDGFGDDGFDVELDELEAEIARELQD